MIESLIRLATDLDRAGLSEKADLVDSLLGEPEVVKLANEAGDLEISDMSPEEAFAVAIEAIRMGLIPSPKNGVDKKEEREGGDKEEPSKEQVQFGDWETENFDICPSAVKAFDAFSKMHGEHEDSTSSVSGDTYEELVLAAMSSTDDLLAIEKEVLKDKAASIEQFEKALSLAREALYYVGVLSEVTSKELGSNFEFLDMHLRVIAENLSGEKEPQKDAENS